MNLRNSLYLLVIFTLFLYGCNSSKPKTLLDYYYAIPFGDKYNETLSIEQKEKLFKAGEWKAMEDSGYANLKSTIDDEMFSEEITIRVWKKGEKVAVTTLYDEGSDCPPLSELFVYEYIKNSWIRIDIPTIEVSDYWANKSNVPAAVSDNASLVEFEPFLDKNSNDIRFEWKHYKCLNGSEDVPDYQEWVNQRSFNAGARQRDYDQVYLQWNSQFTALEMQQSKHTRDKDMDSNSGETQEPGTGLLLGIGEDIPVTYFITFADYEISIKQLNGAILSPQQDDFYIIQPWNAVSSISCDYEQDESSQEEDCTSTATKLIVAIAREAAYLHELSSIENQLSSIAQARCGLNEDQFEAISFIGKNFMQYTFGGSDSECAPPGPGGGFEKDTIVSFNGHKIDMLASSYLNYSDLHMAYDKLFPAETRSNMSYMLCEPEEMLIGLGHENGRLKLHTKNNSGRGYQDSREIDISFTDAPGRFVSRSYPVVGNSAIPDGAIDYFASPDGQYFAVLKNVNDENRLYFYTKDDPTPITRISITGSIVMEEWCDKNYWKKWDRAIDDVKTFIKNQEANK